MPIRINLMAEAIAEDELRRKDPAKRAAFVGAFLVALSLVWFSSTWLTYMMSKQSLNHLENQIQMHTNDYAVVQGNLKKIDDMQKRMTALDKLTAARFLQGNLLNAMQTIYVPNIQLSRLRLEQSYINSTPTPIKNATTGATIARPPEVTEHTTLTLDAKDFSANPGDQINHYKEALLKQELLRSGIDATNGIRLAGPPSAVQNSADNKPFVMFTFECRFFDKNP